MMESDRQPLVDDVCVTNSNQNVNSAENEGNGSYNTPKDGSTLYVSVLGLEVSRNVLGASLALISVTGFTVCLVSLPLYSEYLGKIQISIYHGIFYTSLMQLLVIVPFVFVHKLAINRQAVLLPGGKLKFCVLIGFLITINILLLGYASDPLRTPPVLQSVTFPVTVLYMMLFSFIILRKLPTFSRLVCTGTLMIGLFICLEPQIWGMNKSKSDTENTATSSLAYRILWPLVFALGFLPVSISTVFWERVIKTERDIPVRLFFWCQVFVVIWTVLLFWTDIIPHVGKSGSMQVFLENFVHSLKCHLGMDTSCSDVIAPGWGFTLGGVVGNISTILLMRYADGAVYAAIVQTLVTPSGALFWTLFQADPSLRWAPEFTMATAFTLVGLAIMLPSVFMYTYFNKKEEEEERQGTLEPSVN